MAGDWIKMRGNLWDDPRVAGICDLTDSAEGPVIGALYWLWATADQHTEDGFMPDLTLRQIDRKAGLQGFAAALVSIGWIVESEGGITILRFEEHNGESAKRRCSDAKRKANVRKDADKTRTEEGQSPELLRRIAELEKELEKEKNKDTHTPLASDFVLPKPWGEWAIAETPHWTPDVVRSVAAQFADHHHAQAATSADWLASWRKWCRDELTQRAHPPPRAPPEKAPPAITVPSTDKGAERFAVEMAERAAKASLPPWSKKAAA